MAPRPREPFARKVFKGVLFLELAAVFGVYGLFHAMNSSRGKGIFCEIDWNRPF